jgi:predicted kinase
VNFWPEKLAGLVWPDEFVVPVPGAAPCAWEAKVRELFPGLAERTANTRQDNIYHAEGDVWTHTEMVVTALLNNPGYAAQAAPCRGVLFYAALLHDMAKPETTKEAGDRIVAPGHSAKGAIAARVALWERGVPFLLREHVCRLVEAHQIPFFAFESRRKLPAEYTARLLAQNCSIELLCMLASADIRGRICPDQEKILLDIALFDELARELNCHDAPYAFPDAATRMAYWKGAGTRYADEPVFAEEPFEVTFLAGLPASGKSAYAKELPGDVPVVSYDDLRAELGFKHGHGTGTIVHAAYDKMRSLLRSRSPFVIDATHLSRLMRGRTVTLARSYGASLRVIYFEAPKNVLLSRNAARVSTLTNDKLLQMTGNWEVPGEEEFDHVDLRIEGPVIKKASWPRRVVG